MMNYKKITPAIDVTAQALAFHPVLVPEGTPDILAEDENGKLWLRIKVPEASSVKICIADKVLACRKDPDGVWWLEFPFRSGMNYITILMDGAEILSPYLPIGYGYSRPCNYVALSTPDEDFYRLKDVPHGKVQREYFHSSVTGEWGSCMVYTPPSYEKESDKIFPVLYLQHGHGENETGWVTTGKLQFILDNLIAEGKCTPFVAVMNNGMVQKNTESGRIVDFKLFDSFLLEDVIPFIETRYRTGREKKRRAMAGLSMGSLQTSITGFRHPELFCGLGIFSGFLHDWIQGSEIDIIRRTPGDDSHLALLNYPDEFNSTFDVFFRAIGDADPFLPYFQSDDERMERNHLKQIRRIYCGSHDWNVWRKCIRDFSVLLFKAEK